jgi:hypothetical protein
MVFNAKFNLLTFSFEEGKECDCVTDEAIGLQHSLNRINEIDSAFASLYQYNN